MECNYALSNIRILLRHLSKIHGISLWYEKGLTKKRVSLDGLIEDISDEKRKKANQALDASN